jgi:hypothetical protein
MSEKSESLGRGKVVTTDLLWIGCVGSDEEETGKPWYLPGYIDILEGSCVFEASCHRHCNGVWSRASFITNSDMQTVFLEAKQVQR